MVYLTKKDILARTTAQNLHVVTEGDDETLDRQEIDAVSVVSSYLSHDYDTEAIFQTVDTPEYVFHPTIKRMTIDIMLYNLHNDKVNPRQIPDNVIAKRDDAINWLKDVANPKTNTNAPFLPKKVFENEKRNNSFAWGSAPKRDNAY